VRVTGGREAYFAIDGERRVVLWGPAAEALLGFGTEEALGQHCWQVLKANGVFGRPLYCDRCAACLKSDVFVAPPAHHLLLTNKNGHVTRLVHELVPLPSGPGARALVLLSETPAQLSQPADPSLVVDETQPGLGTFGTVIKGLAALGILADSMSSTNFYQALDSTLDRVLGLTRGEAAEVFLRDRFSGEMCLTAHRGLFRSAFRQITRFGPNQGFPGLVATTGTPLFTDELNRDDRFLRTRVKEKGIRSYISIPLGSDGGTIGCLNVAFRRPVESSSSHLQLLSWLAAPLASAAELATLRSNAKLDWLDEGDAPLGAVPGQVLKAMMDISEADQGIINLWWADDGEICTRASSGDVIPCLSSRNRYRCPVRAQGRPVVTLGPGSNGPVSCRESLGDARTALCVPIGAPGRVIGAVSLRFARSQPVPTRPMALLGAMSRSSARVLRAARPYLRPDRHPPEETSYRPLGQPVGTLDNKESEAPAPAAPPFLDIRCFGSFQVLRDGQPLSPSSFGRRQSLTVLKVLVTRRGRPVSTDFLSEVLWPEAEPEAADRRLWVIIHSLRTALEPGLKHGQLSSFIHRNGDAYSFDPAIPYRLDVEEFMGSLAQGEGAEERGDTRDAVAKYREAARLYQADYIEEEQYSDWCSAEREYLREVYLDLLKRLASLHACLNEWDRSITWHRRALLMDGLREEVHRELMRCLWSAGRRDEALRQYLECREVLARELGVEPLPETSELYRRIMEEDLRSSPF